MKQTKEDIECLKEAYSNGAKVEYYCEGIESWMMASYPAWLSHLTYRIDPNCEYAKNGYGLSEGDLVEIIHGEDIGGEWIVDAIINSHNCVVRAGDYTYVISCSKLRKITRVDSSCAGLKTYFNLNKTKEKQMSNKLPNGMYKEFSKDMLESGGVVKIKSYNGYKFHNVVVNGNDFILLNDTNGWDWVDTHKKNIVAVYRYKDCNFNGRPSELCLSQLTCLWERKEEPVVVEISASEAIARLEKIEGCKVKLVK